MMMITSIDSYVQTVTNVPALLQNKDFLENLHPRYTEVLSRSNTQNPNASPAPTAPLDAAIQSLLDSGVQPDTTVNKHSIGVVGLLCAKTKTQEFNTNFENFLVQVSGFMEVADWGQLRLVAGVVAEIASAITDQMIRRTQPILGINLLGNMATSLQAHEKMLTSVHACVLQLCCASYNFKAGLAYIVDDFEEFSGDLKSSDNTHYLLQYLYYSGITHTALKNYESATYFFEACTRVPAITLSHIMLESYKKYILISLINTGEVPPPHKSSAQVVNRLLKPSAISYTELASSFAIGSESLGSCISKHGDVWRRDGNGGLVKQVKTAHVNGLVRKLTRTFITLSLEDVGRRAGVCERDFVAGAENLVVRMIEKRDVVAKVNQRDGMVKFVDGGGDHSRGESGVRVNVYEMLEGKLNSCIELNKRINTMNERISTNPEFISKVVISLDSAGSNAAGGSGTSILSGGDVTTGGGSSSMISSSGGGGRGGGGNVGGGNSSGVISSSANSNL